MITSIYAWIIWDKRYKYYGESESWNVNFSPQWSHTLTILFLTITGHIIDRQVISIDNIVIKTAFYIVY